MRAYDYQFKAEKIHLTLTLGEVDALIKAGSKHIEWCGIAPDVSDALESALQKLDVAVNQ